MRGADARSAQICRSNGVARCFHVSAYSVEPAEAVLARNLFSKDNWRAALCDEPMELRPEMALVLDPLALARGTERLAWAGAGPDGAIVGPSRKAECVRPDPDPCEEMALREIAQIRSLNAGDAAVVNDAIGDQSLLDEIAEPLRCIGLKFVVVGGHAGTSSTKRT